MLRVLSYNRSLLLLSTYIITCFGKNALFCALLLFIWIGVTMTLKIPIQETVKMVGSLGFCGNDMAESVTVSKREMVTDEKVYVAVTGKDLESKSSLVWAIQNSGGREFCIVHVHQPIQILVTGAMFRGQDLRVHRKEKEKAYKNLDKYLHICRQMQVSAEKIWIEMESVEKGILQLISQRGVRNLVMGAAADRYYSMKMRDLRSKKAICICREAPATCHLWFTCKGYLICSREAKRRDNLYLECASSSSSLSQRGKTRETESVPSSSIVKYGDESQVAVKEARLEVYKREEAERFAIDAIKRAKQSESAPLEELNRRKETEKALRKAKEDIEMMRSECETRVKESNMKIQKLQEKYSLSVKALRRLGREKEELKIELRKVSTLKSNHKNHEPPQYFICPITKDVMEDPQVAPDGFTYEGEAIRGWFERGNETSPMTNKTLSHTSLVPNLALRSAIQEWLQASTS